MTVANPRYQPLIELDTRQLREMVAPVARGAAVREAERLDGGLVNTVYRVALAGGTGVVVRVYSVATAEEVEAECRLLMALHPELPVPQVLWADADGGLVGHRYVIYAWMDGITLDEYRRGATPAELSRLAAPIGGVLANISQHDGGPRAAPRDLVAAMDDARSALQSGLARERIGEELAQGLDEVLAAHQLRLSTFDRSHGLMHGDFGGRNLLVAGREGEPWRLTAVLDWDGAGAGTPMWDLGSFFRYSHRYDDEFRRRFADGYVAAGGELQDDWWLMSRLLDSTRVVEILDQPRPMPRLFAECRLAVTGLLEDFETADR